jgi:hypothetical protein
MWVCETFSLYLFNFILFFEYLALITGCSFISCVGAEDGAIIYTVGIVDDTTRVLDTIINNCIFQHCTSEPLAV